MSVSEWWLHLPTAVRNPIGSVLVRAPAPGAKLMGFMASPRARAEPWAIYRVLRDRRPVFRTPFGATIVSRHADALAVLRSPGVSVDESRAAAFAATPRGGAFSRMM